MIVKAVVGNNAQDPRGFILREFSAQKEAVLNLLSEKGNIGPFTSKAGQVFLRASIKLEKPVFGQNWVAIAMKPISDLKEVAGAAEGLEKLVQEAIGRETTFTLYETEFKRRVKPAAR